MAEVDDVMVVSGNGTAHDAVHEQDFDHNEEDGSMEIIARIPNYNSETKEGNGSSNEAFLEQVEESNDSFKELHVKDSDDLSAQPKCQTDTGNGLGHKMDTKNKTDANNAKKTNKSGPVPSEKKSGNSKPAIVQVKARLSKPGKSDSATSTANVVQSEGVKEKSKVKSTKAVHGSTTEGRTHSSESSTTGDEKPQRHATLPAYSLVLGVTKEQKNGKSSILSSRKRFMQKKRKKNTLQAKTKEHQEAEIKMLRKSLMFKATPMPSFYHETPPKTELKKIPTTRPKSPKLGRKKDSPPVEMEANGGNNTFRPRLSLDAKKSLNDKAVTTALSPLPTKKPTRKSLPKLPSEKTKLPSEPDSKDTTSCEVTTSSNETNEHEPDKDPSYVQEADTHAVEEPAN